MKIRIYFKPGWVVLGLVFAATMLWFMVLRLEWWGRWLCVMASIFYSVLALLSLFALVRCHALERWMSWETPERLLILAPHQDDGVICAGGVGIRNQQLGGETHIIYLVQDDKPGMAECRKREALAAWAIAGVPAENLLHLDMLPRLYERAPKQLDKAALDLDDIIESLSPTVLILPLFEGGHIHHDVLNHLVTSVLKLGARVKVFEAPEYSPYVSLRRTPHRVISLCGRWLAGLVSYCGPPDGIDDRTVLKVRLSKENLVVKRQMLAAFESQHGDSLSANCSYSDRLISWQPRPYRSRPFREKKGYFSFVRSLHEWLPSAIVTKVFPVQLGTVGREPNITSLDEELQKVGVPDEKQS